MNIPEATDLTAEPQLRTPAMIVIRTTDSFDGELLLQIAGTDICLPMPVSVLRLESLPERGEILYVELAISRRLDADPARYLDHRELKRLHERRLPFTGVIHRVSDRGDYLLISPDSTEVANETTSGLLMAHITDHTMSRELSRMLGEPGRGNLVDLPVEFRLGQKEGRGGRDNQPCALGTRIIHTR